MRHQYVTNTFTSIFSEGPAGISLGTSGVLLSYSGKFTFFIPIISDQSELVEVN